MARESLGGDTKYSKEDVYEGETEADEVVGNVIKRRKLYNIAFQIGVIM